ncbi:TetR/AcrR family transcriptional regulator [Heyndrickxia ginsengihumi]|uniref:TetR family transcriptional regulator n=1 Tax=Heyndrickxia ginsengihumi TaxID=363870 RepID=A0A0A6VEJ6_9BACI|nr:TetR/AcrR family transcriptional regulator [Heyndrickxia ginsengihumi]KHD85888.1 TetR family transcriptional regulator [Heyndrickxia ginsengihumi]MBE6184703.1 TetR/AcrR family transcriptional regulator [Bacillus sp. (in: firmicutes)]MCM3023611.1 TetR/AcrR family transcriptional regulator [Heyndrickxia ginsengihumi]NEY18876.1 TetR/AcrR family transcriptional regulator [Heyndrickxia ginsengihumi]
MEIDRKHLVVEAAKTSFSQYGYKATTMDQIAKMANVGKGTIYTFFKNKEELFDEIISSLIQEMIKVADEVMDEKESFYANLHAALFRLLEFRKYHLLTIKLFQEQREIGTPAVNEMVKKIENQIIFHIKDLLQRAIDHKKIKPCNPEITAFVIFKLYVALIFDWEQNHEALTKEEIAGLFDLYLVKGLEL